MSSEWALHADSCRPLGTRSCAMDPPRNSMHQGRNHSGAIERGELGARRGAVELRAPRRRQGAEGSMPERPCASGPALARAVPPSGSAWKPSARVLRMASAGHETAAARVGEWGSGTSQEAEDRDPPTTTCASERSGYGARMRGESPNTTTSTFCRRSSTTRRYHLNV